MRAYVSIIIPVYNSEKYLEQCLDSVLNQNFTDYEVILIDDGSTDNSRIIYEQYADKDKRFTTYYQQNKGVSAARNKGLDTAQGDVIFFLDSDDVIAHNFLESVLEWLDEDHDLVCFAAAKFKDSIQFADIEKISIQEFTAKQFIEDLLYHRKQLSITRSAFKKNKYSQLRFREEIYIGEDIIMLLEILVKYETSIPFIKTELYGYRIYEGSLTHYGNWRRKLTGLTAMDIMESILVSYKVHMEKALINRRMNSARLIYKAIPWKEKEERNYVWNCIRKYRKTVIFDDQSKMGERLAALISLFGQRIFRLFLCWVEIVRQKSSV